MGLAASLEQKDGGVCVSVCVCVCVCVAETVSSLLSEVNVSSKPRARKSV